MKYTQEEVANLLKITQTALKKLKIPNLGGYDKKDIDNYLKEYPYKVGNMESVEYFEVLEKIEEELDRGVSPEQVVKDISKEFRRRPSAIESMLPQEETTEEDTESIKYIEGENFETFEEVPETSKYWTRDEEYNVFKKYNYLKYKYIQTEEVQYKTEFTNLLELIIQKYQKLIHSFYKKYSFLDKDDFFSFGVLTLITSANNYNYEQGRFTTYLYWCLKGQFLTHYKQTLTEETPSEFCDSLVESTEMITNRSLTLRNLISRLPENYQIVLNRYYGLDGPSQSYTQMSTDLEVSGSAIAATGSRALESLKKEILREGLTFADFCKV